MFEINLQYLETISFIKTVAECYFDGYNHNNQQNISQGGHYYIFCINMGGHTKVFLKIRQLKVKGFG